MKIYAYTEWDFEWIDEDHPGGFDERLYVDLEGNLITGILEGFYGYTSNTKDPKNCQEVKNGRRI